MEVKGHFKQRLFFKQKLNRIWKLSEYYLLNLEQVIAKNTIVFENRTARLKSWARNGNPVVTLPLYDCFISWFSLWLMIFECVCVSDLRNQQSELSGLKLQLKDYSLFRRGFMFQILTIHPTIHFNLLPSRT